MFLKDLTAETQRTLRWRREFQRGRRPVLTRTSPPTQNRFIVACKFNHERCGSHASQVNIDFVNLGHGSLATRNGGGFHRTWGSKSAGFFRWAGLGKVD